MTRTRLDTIFLYRHGADLGRHLGIKTCHVRREFEAAREAYPDLTEEWTIMSMAQARILHGRDMVGKGTVLVRVLVIEKSAA